MGIGRRFMEGRKNELHLGKPDRDINGKRERTTCGGPCRTTPKKKNLKNKVQKVQIIQSYDSSTFPRGVRSPDLITPVAGVTYKLEK
jgi:hypothetical protein